MSALKDGIARHLSPADYDFPEDLQTDPEPFVWPLFSVVLLSVVFGVAVGLAVAEFWS